MMCAVARWFGRSWNGGSATSSKGQASEHEQHEPRRARSSRASESAVAELEQRRAVRVGGSGGGRRGWQLVHGRQCTPPRAPENRLRYADATGVALASHARRAPPMRGLIVGLPAHRRQRLGRRRHHPRLRPDLRAARPGRAHPAVRGRRRLLVGLLVPAQCADRARAALVPRGDRSFLRCCPSLSHLRLYGVAGPDLRAPSAGPAVLDADRDRLRRLGLLVLRGRNGMEMGLLAAAYSLIVNELLSPRAAACSWLAAGVVLAVTTRFEAVLYVGLLALSVVVRPRAPRLLGDRRRLLGTVAAALVLAAGRLLRRPAEHVLGEAVATLRGVRPRGAGVAGALELPRFFLVPLVALAILLALLRPRSRAGVRRADRRRALAILAAPLAGRRRDGRSDRKALGLPRAACPTSRFRRRCCCCRCCSRPG